MLYKYISNQSPISTHNHLNQLNTCFDTVNHLHHICGTTTHCFCPQLHWLQVFFPVSLFLMIYLFLKKDLGYNLPTMTHFDQLTIFSTRHYLYCTPATHFKFNARLEPFKFTITLFGLPSVSLEPPSLTVAWKLEHEQCHRCELSCHITLWFCMLFFPYFCQLTNPFFQF